MATAQLATNDLVRLFIRERTNNSLCECPEYQGCVGVGGVSKNRGDPLSIKCPSDKLYRKFDEVLVVPGEEGRVTLQLTMRLMRNERSVFSEWQRKDCPVDLHLHFGLCQNPTDFTQFDKSIVIQDALFTNYSTDAIATIDPGQRGVITETIDVNAAELYDILPSYNLLCIGSFAGNAPYHAVVFEDGVCRACTESRFSCKNLAITPIDITSTEYAVLHAGNRIYAVKTDGTLVGYDAGGIADVVSPLVSSPALEAIDYIELDLNVGESLVSSVDGAYFKVLGTDQGRVFVAQQQVYPRVFNFTPYTIETGSSVTALDADDCHILVGLETGEVLVLDPNDSNITTLGSPNDVEVTAAAIYSQDNYLVGYEDGSAWKTCCAGHDGWERVKFTGWSANTTPIADVKVLNQDIVFIASGASLFVSYDGGCYFNRVNIAGVEELTEIVCCPSGTIHMYYLMGIDADGDTILLEATQ